MGFVLSYVFPNFFLCFGFGDAVGDLWMLGFDCVFDRNLGDFSMREDGR